jgi:hypothetical protein
MIIIDKIEKSIGYAMVIQFFPTINYDRDLAYG